MVWHIAGSQYIYKPYGCYVNQVLITSSPVKKWGVRKVRKRVLSHTTREGHSSDWSSSWGDSGLEPQPGGGREELRLPLSTLQWTLCPCLSPTVV